MKSKHITQILDQQKFSDLSEEALANIQNHNLDCSECLQAFKAAQLSSVLLQSNTEVINAASPYFQAKVLNAWREKQNLRKPVAAFIRWWQASAALVLTMLMLVISLILFTVVAQTENSVAVQKKISEYNLYSTDSVILNQKPPKNLTTEQAFEILESTRLTQNRK